MIRHILTLAIISIVTFNSFGSAKKSTFVDFTYRMSNYVMLPPTSIESMYEGDIYTLEIDDLFGLDEDMSENSIRGEIVDYAKEYIGCRYRRGGKGPKVFEIGRAHV